MLRRPLLLLSAVIAGTLGAAVSLTMSPAAADQYSVKITALESKATALQQRIMALEQQGATDVAKAATLQQSLASTQSSLTTAQVQFNQANAQLAATTGELTATQTELTSDRSELSRLLVGIYRLQGNGTVAAALIDSKSFLDAIDVVTSLHQVSSKVRELVVSMHQKEQLLAALRDRQDAEFEQANQLVTTLQSLDSQQSSQQAALQSQASHLSGSANRLITQLEAVQTQIDQLQAQEAQAEGASGGTSKVEGNALPPFAYGPRVDYFPWGQCTWYVASERTVTWDGDAWEWATAAKAAGMQEGFVPKVGAIVVWGPGNGYSAIGHVAYVVAVQSPSSFTVDEGNYLGLGVVDQRSVTTLDDVEAFIY
jgi:surface antigen